MIVNITPTLRIQSDSHSWAVAELVGKRKNGKDRWDQLTWHESLPAAIMSIAEKQIRDDPLVTDSLMRALDRAETIHEKLRTAVVRRGGTAIWEKR